MTVSLPWAEPIDTARLRLTPMNIADVEELFEVLDDVRLHRFTGGRPDTLAELQRRVEGWSTQRSPDGEHAWCNWVIRLDDDIIGTVQTTVRARTPRDEPAASLGWVVGSDHQGCGYATEAALGLAGWLLGLGIQPLEATIYPGHEASEKVARAVGLRATDEVVDGEIVWRSVESAPEAG
jgi:RimJ/RimL family protein N-acetyltransferase